MARRAGRYGPGWARPCQSRRYHYFLADEMRSICGAWTHGGIRRDEDDDHYDNCPHCRKAVARLRASAARAGEDDGIL